MVMIAPANSHTITLSRVRCLLALATRPRLLSALRWHVLAEEPAWFGVSQLQLQFLESLYFNLPNALARESNLDANLLESQWFLAFKTEAQAEHACISFVDGIKELENGGEVFLALNVVLGSTVARIFEDVGKVCSLAVLASG